jgi:hypothetical protein
MPAWPLLFGDARLAAAFSLVGGRPGRASARILFGVTLRAQPSNAAIAIHPVINVGFAFQAGNFPGIGAGILSHNIPVVLCVSNGFECHFCFCHDLLCTFLVHAGRFFAPL